MPKSRVRKKKNQKRSPTKRSNPFSGIGPDFLDLIADYGGAEEDWLPADTRRQFETLLESQGQILYRHAMLLASSEVYVPRVMLFSPDLEDDEGEWLVEVVNGALPAFGWDSMPAIQDKLVGLADVLEFDAVAALSYVCPMTPQLPGYFTLCVLANGDGDVAVAGLLPDSYRLLPPTAQPVERMLSYLLELSNGFDGDLVGDAARKLKTFMACNSEASDAQLVSELQNGMAPVTDRMAHAVELVVSCMADSLDNIVRRTKDDVLGLVENIEKNHAKQLKKVRGQLDKTEMLFKGCQARADRLSVELKALRKQTRAKPSSQPAAATGGDTFNQAIERLFA